MSDTTPIEAKLGDATILIVPQHSDGGGMQDVGITDVVDLGEVFKAIESVASSIRQKLAGVSPDKTKVELSVGFAARSGKLLALLGDAEGSGAIKVTMEWAASDEGDGAS